MSQEGKDKADLLWARVDEVFPSILLMLGDTKTVKVGRNGIDADEGKCRETLPDN